MSLAELEREDGVRWVDVHHGKLRSARSLGTLNRLCDGALTQRMARDLATPRRFPAAGTYAPTSIRMTAGLTISRTSVSRTCRLTSSSASSARTVTRRTGAALDRIFCSFAIEASYE